MKKILVNLICVLSLSTLFFSCTTTVNVQVKRPAELNLGKAKSIAIEPIRPYSKSNSRKTDDRRIISYLETEIKDKLESGGYFTVIGPEDRITAADVYLDGEIVSFYVDDNRKSIRKKNPNYTAPSKSSPKKSGGSAPKRVSREPEYITTHVYVRKVKLVYRYTFIDAYTNQVIAEREYEISCTSGEEDHIVSLPSPYSLVKSDLDKIVKNISKDVQPYFVYVQYKLLKDKTKNSDFKDADKLADDGMIPESYNAFLKVYKSTGMFEAGYNAAILLEAQGYYQDAEMLMSELYENTKDDRAYEALKDIRYELNQYKKLVNQNQNRQ